MRTNLSLEDSIKTFETFLAERAKKEGYAAFQAGVEQPTAPVVMGVFAGYWVEGWLAAAKDAVGRAPKPFEDTYQGFPLVSATSAAATLPGNHQLN